MNGALPLFKSLYGRLSLGIAAVTLCAIIFLGLSVDWVVRENSRAELQQMVDTDLSGLADIYASGGKAELIARVNDRLALAPSADENPYYLVANASGQPVAGNIRTWPSLSAENSDDGIIELADGTAAYGRATMLGEDVRIVVARGTSHQQELVTKIRWAFIAAGAAILLLVILIGGLAAKALQRRIDDINSAYRMIGSSDANERVAGSDRQDELGELARHTNAMLDRVSNLIKSHRNISDHMAHEMRTPLAHLDSRLLRALETSGDNALTQNLASAREEIRGIIRMLDSLLDIASSEAQRGDVSRLEPIDISEIAENLADLFSDSADELGLDFVTDITQGIWLKGDAMQITRMLSNLLDNAFKYVPEGGRVTFEVHEGPHITVCDNGPGVPENMREIIFERFQRADIHNCKGHGLGLALAQAIALRHGLKITCGDADRGAKFEIKVEEAL